MFAAVKTLFGYAPRAPSPPPELAYTFHKRGLERSDSDNDTPRKRARRRVRRRAKKTGPAPRDPALGLPHSSNTYQIAEPGVRRLFPPRAPQPLPTGTGVIQIPQIRLGDGAADPPRFTREEKGKAAVRDGADRQNQTTAPVGPAPAPATPQRSRPGGRLGAVRDNGGAPITPPPTSPAGPPTPATGTRQTVTRTPGAATTTTNTAPLNLPLWRATPNARARAILAANDSDPQAAADDIKHELREPEYSSRHVEIRDSMWQVMDAMETYARTHFANNFVKNPANDAALTLQFATLIPETVKLIGCVASGGPAGEQGWRDLFYNSQKRAALVLAIIGKVLVEQVYQHVFFGGSQEEENHIIQLQTQYSRQDGFVRNFHYAEFVRAQLNVTENPPAHDLPAGFHAHTKVIVHSIFTHLEFILRLNPNYDHDTQASALLDELYSIVAKAGIISLAMRLDPHTAYYFTPMFKEDEFSQRTGECLNHTQMEQEDPTVRTVWPNNYTPEDIRLASFDRALTQILIMDGVTAYRLGGWETSDSAVRRPKYVPGAQAMGIRARHLLHGWVYCRWGRPRAFARGVPADVAEVHGKQWGGGFVEFKDVTGVPAQVGHGN